MYNIYKEKILLWIVISAKGIGQVYIAPSKQAINQHVYLEKCIKNRLVPFLRKYHSGGKYVFWPDLATSHYANSVQNWLSENNITVVAKADNPANVPEVRPIEDLFAYIKRKVYRKGWSANNIHQLEQRIRSTMRNLPNSIVQKLMGSTIRRLDHVRRYGII